MTHLNLLQMGLSAAHECSKVGNSVLLLEQFSLFNYDGSSGDIVRMYRVGIYPPR